MKRHSLPVYPRTILSAAVLAAAAIGSSANASVLYTWNTFPAAGTASYSDGTNWTASGGTANAANYPGGDAAVLDDAALINPTVGAYGTFTINYTGMTAPSISTLTLKGPLTTASPLPVATDILVFNANAPMTLTGALTLSASNTTVGKVTFNSNSTVSVASIPTVGSVALNVPSGTLTSTGAFGGNSSILTFNISNGATANLGGMNAGSGSSTLAGTVSGNLTTSSYTTNPSSDSGNLTISSNAGNVNLGTVNIGRSSGTTVTAAATGIHVKGGTVTMGNTVIASGNSASALEVGAGSLTVSGTFVVGGNTGGRTSVLWVDGGTLLDTNAAGLNVGQVSNLTVGGGGTGQFNLQSGTATLEKLTLGITQTTTAAAATGNNSGNLSVTGGSLYIGSGGIIGTAIPFSGTTIGSVYNIVLTGGTIGAKATWSSSANMAINTNAVTFQAADASNLANDISLTGALTGSGSLTKTGGGILTLGGTASYAGATSINAGTLLVNGAITASTATVGVAGTLGGTGTLTPAVTDNGTLNPGTTGAGSIGTLTLGGGLTLGDNATYAVDFNASSADKLVVTGNILLGSNDTLAMNSLDATTAGTYVIATYTGTETGTFANLPANVTVDYTTGNAITITVGTVAAPEPASLAVLSLGAAALLARRRRI